MTAETTGMSEEHEGREECCRPAGSLDLCVCGWQVHNQLFLLLLDLCICLKICTSSAIQTGTQETGLEKPR